MNIRSILCVFDGLESQLTELNSAMALCKAMTAHLRIFHVTPVPDPSLGAFAASAAITSAMKAENDARLQKAWDYTAHYAALHRLPLDEMKAPSTGAAVWFIHRTGAVDDVLAHEGRMSDMLVVGHSTDINDIVHDPALIAALFDTGRPVLITPRADGILPTEWKCRAIALAWNGSLESARALYNALPFFERAGKAHVLAAPRHEDAHKPEDHATLQHYIRSHGVACEIVTVARDHRPAGEALLAKARELECDMLVMGGYGHARTREMMLGGVTNYMLRKADLPLLLSH